jgi:hypothetical protein
MGQDFLKNILNRKPVQLLYSLDSKPVAAYAVL